MAKLQTTVELMSSLVSRSIAIMDDLAVLTQSMTTGQGSMRRSLVDFREEMAEMEASAALLSTATTVAGATGEGVAPSASTALGTGPLNESEDITEEERKQAQYVKVWMVMAAEFCFLSDLRGCPSRFVHAFIMATPNA